LVIEQKLVEIYGSIYHPQTTEMNRIRQFYTAYKPYVFSDGWYYVFILVFLGLLFTFFS